MISMKPRKSRPKRWWTLLLLSLLTVSGILYAFRSGDPYFEIVKNMDIFSAVYRDLDNYYVDSIQPGQLMQTGIQAMVGSLDPYTTFYSRRHLKDLEFLTTGRYGGIGASVRREEDWMVISEVYPGSPAQQAGIRPGDIIDSLDGRTARGMTQDQMSGILRGRPGTSLSMVLENPVDHKIRDREITRREIDVKSVSYAGMISSGVAYIRLQQFTQYCSNELKDAFDSLRRTNPGMKGLILDLRGNPGGLLEEAVRTVNLFVDQGQTVVSTRGRVHLWDHDYRTGEAADDDSIRLAILINPGTASASEIVAGAVQDLDRGIIIGQKSFGKGLVQTTHDLPYDTKLKLTTARYYTPSGRCIQAIDYSKRNPDGSVVYFPDSLRKTFHTRNGRIVRDEGGIEPDIRLEPQVLSPLAISLLDHNYIFDFATRYYYDHSSLSDPSGFRLGGREFERFVRFLKGKDNQYSTGSEEALNEFRQIAEKEHYFNGIRPQYDSLLSRMESDKAGDLFRNRHEVLHLLDEEIADRYDPVKGRFLVDLRQDADVLEARSVLSNPTLYEQILEGKMDGPFALAGSRCPPTR